MFREKDISVSSSQLRGKKPHEVLVCQLHGPVLVGHMNEANVNDEFIINMLNHANMTCLQYILNRTAPLELLIDVHYGALSLCEPL